jgi:hypothetical protein
MVGFDKERSRADGLAIVAVLVEFGSKFLAG